MKQVAEQFVWQHSTLVEMEATHNTLSPGEVVPDHESVEVPVLDVVPVAASHCGTHNMTSILLHPQF